MKGHRILPESWEIKPLGQVAEKITKGATPTTYGYKFQDSGIRFIRIENVHNGNIDVNTIKDYISVEAHESQKRSQLEENDLLFSIAGTIGETCIIKKAILPANTNQAFAIIRGTKKEILPEFLFFQLNAFVSRIKSKARGGAMNNISLGDLNGISITIPPLKDQKAIVEKIEEIFSELDAGRRQLEIVKGQLKTYKKAILKYAFEGGLTYKKKSGNGNFSAWEICKIADVGEIVSGGTPSTKEPDYWDGDVPWITPADLSGYYDKYIKNGRRSITIKGLGNSSARMIPSGSVLYSSRAPIGYVAIAKNDLCTNQGFKSIIPGSRVTSEYLYYFLKAITQKIIEKASGTTFKEVSLKTISSIEIVVPPRDQQKMIVAEIEHRFSFCDKMEEAISEAIQKSETLKQSILNLGFEGKLVKPQTN
jgi:type I restriction enzyme S subunit